MGKVTTVKKLSKSKGLKGKTTVVVGGTFDILHTAHLDFLEKSKKYGDVLIVGIADNKNVKERKGNKRPIFNVKQRARMIAALDVVDYVFISYHSAYSPKFIKRLKPSVLVFPLEGGTKLHRLKYKNIIEKKFPKTKVRFVDTATPAMSTTEIINKILNIFSGI